MLSDKKATYDLVCEKCGENLSHDEFDEKVSVTCMICRKDKSVAEVSTCNQITAICSECIEFLNEKNQDKVPEYIRPVASWIRITKDMKLKPYSEILNQTIQI